MSTNQPTPDHVLISPYGTRFYETARDSAEDMVRHGCTFSHLEWLAYAWPGGYPIYYTTLDGGCLCPTCANENMNLTLDKDYEQWFIMGQDINYEDSDLYCDNCNAAIAPAYGDDDEGEEA